MGRQTNVATQAVQLTTPRCISSSVFFAG